jgi:membrane protein YqaA with SNARE-associated domain
MPSITGFLTAILTQGYEVVYRWGYLGLFLVNVLEAMSFSIFPLPTMLFVFTFGGILNPFLVTIFSALGGAVGTVFPYILGRGFKDIMEKKYSKQLAKTRNKFEKYKGVWWIGIVNVTPLPEGIVSLFCGIINYDFKRFFVTVVIARIIFNLILAYSGYYSVSWVLKLIEIQLPLV